MEKFQKRQTGGDATGFYEHYFICFLERMLTHEKA